MPSNSTLPPSAALHRSTGAGIGERNNLSLASQIPDDGVARAAGRCKDLLRNTIPRKRCNLVQTSTAAAWAIRGRRVLQIPDPNLEMTQEYQSLVTRKVALKTIEKIIVEPTLTCPLVAPEASKFFATELKSRPRIGPSWLLVFIIRVSDGLEERQDYVCHEMLVSYSSLARILAGSQRASSPLSMPAATRP